MTPKPNTIETLRDMGYDCGIAHGDAQVEQNALAAAAAAAEPALLQAQAVEVTTDTIRDLEARGELPTQDADKQAIVARIAQSAIDMLTARADEVVAFQQLALAAAQSMPTVWHVSGPGVSAYVACDESGAGADADSQAMIDSFSDPTAFAERVAQLS